MLGYGNGSAALQKDDGLSIKSQNEEFILSSASHLGKCLQMPLKRQMASVPFPTVATRCVFSNISNADPK